MTVQYVCDHRRKIMTRMALLVSMLKLATSVNDGIGDTELILYLSEQIREEYSRLTSNKFINAGPVAAHRIDEGSAVYVGRDNKVRKGNTEPLNDMQHMVRDFMIKMEQVRGTTPEMRDHMLRFRLIWEESHELCHAILAGDFAQSIDGMCDLLYVVFGTAEAFGINLQPFFEEVHRTNMLKEKNTKDRWGKVIKPEGWQPPRIREMLDKLTE